ncbi:hypothetical protein ASF90_17780 [Xanthomonas sp. Leaf148]|nr:hypothetical protein ASF90_17780 [Xanthomonas sp. Leaf148]
MDLHLHPAQRTGRTPVLQTPGGALARVELPTARSAPAERGAPLQAHHAKVLHSDLTANGVA